MLSIRHQIIGSCMFRHSYGLSIAYVSPQCNRNFENIPMRRIDYTVSGDLKHSPETQTVHVTPNKGRSSPIVYRKIIVQPKPYPMARYVFQQQKRFTLPLDWMNKQDILERQSFVDNNGFKNNQRRSSVQVPVPQGRTSYMFPAGMGEFSDLDLFIRNYEEEDINVE